MVITFTELGHRRKCRFRVWKVDEKFMMVSDEQERDYNEDNNMEINSV